MLLALRCWWTHNRLLAQYASILQTDRWKQNHDKTNYSLDRLHIQGMIYLPLTMSDFDTFGQTKLQYIDGLTGKIISFFQAEEGKSYGKFNNISCLTLIQ